MNKESTPRPPQAVSLGLLSIILGIALGVVWILIPDPVALMKRQARDGSYERALQTLKAIPSEVRDKDPRKFDLMELQLTRRLMPPDPSASEIRDQILAAAQASLAYQQDPEFVQELYYRIPHAPSAREAWNWIKPLLGDFAPAVQAKISQALVDRALAANEPREAALLREDFLAYYPGSEEVLADVVRLWRMAGQPEMGLRAISKCCLGKKTANPFSRRLTHLRLQLCLELGRASEAFDAARELYRHASEEERDAAFEELHRTALAAGRLRDLGPFIRQRAAENPQHAGAWRQFAKFLIASGDQPGAIEAFKKLRQIDPADLAASLQLAQLYEWNGKPNEAFEIYASLAKRGQSDILARLISLNRGLYRDDDLGEVFRNIESTLESQGLVVEAARLYFRIADYDMAWKYYERQLRLQPKDFEVRLEYALNLMNMLEYPRALEVLQEAGKLKPGEEKVLRPLAETLVQLGRMHEALAVFKSLSSTSEDEAIVTQYVNLAGSLGQLEDVINGLKIKIKNSPDTKPRDFLRLAAVQRQTQKVTDSRETLREGVRRFHTDPDLIVQTAYADGDAGDFLEAAKLLATHPGLYTEAEVVQYYTSLLLQAQDYVSAGKFITQVKNPGALETPGMLEAQAHIFEANKQLDKAALLYEKLYHLDRGNLHYVMNHARMLAIMGRAKEAKEIVEPYLARPTRQILRLAAQVFGDAGDTQAAENLQKRYLASNPRDIPEAWGYLGDIMLTRGDRTNAKRAYRRGAEEMLKRVSQNP